MSIREQLVDALEVSLSRTRRTAGLRTGLSFDDTRTIVAAVAEFSDEQVASFNVELRNVLYPNNAPVE